MRHRNAGRQLSRNSSHRGAMFKNMAAALLRHEVIETTLPKAKDLRRVVEPLITLAKIDSVSKRRLAFARIHDREMVTKLFNEIGPRYKARPGGYCRILHLSKPRLGDNGARAILEFVERTPKPKEEEAAAEKS